MARSQRLHEALAGRAARLVRIVIDQGGTGRPLACSAARNALRDLAPEEVFRRRWERYHESELPPELLAAFHELLDSVAQDSTE